MFLPNYDNTGVTVELGELLASGFKLWDFDYPIPQKEIQYNGKTCTVDFDRERLQQKIVDHYRFRQIGQETPARFKHYLKARMNEIMPYYVQVYEFDAKFRNIDDPLESYNLVETFRQSSHGSGRVTGKNSSENNGTTNRQGNKVVKFSDTPQGSVDNIDTYLTTATKEDDTDKVTDTGKTSGTSEQTTQDSGGQEHTLTRRGNIGVQPLGGEVENIRNAFINIDLQIIEELNDLFLMVY